MWKNRKCQKYENVNARQVIDKEVMLGAAAFTVSRERMQVQAYCLSLCLCLCLGLCLHLCHCLFICLYLCAFAFVFAFVFLLHKSKSCFLLDVENFESRLLKGRVKIIKMEI